MNFKNFIFVLFTVFFFATNLFAQTCGLLDTNKLNVQSWNIDQFNELNFHLLDTSSYFFEVFNPAEIMSYSNINLGSLHSLSLSNIFFIELLVLARVLSQNLLSFCFLMQHPFDNQVISGENFRVKIITELPLVFICCFCLIYALPSNIFKPPLCPLLHPSHSLRFPSFYGCNLHAERVKRRALT